MKDFFLFNRKRPTNRGEQPNEENQIRRPVIHHVRQWRVPGMEHRAPYPAVELGYAVCEPQKRPTAIDGGGGFIFI